MDLAIIGYGAFGTCSSKVSKLLQFCDLEAVICDRALVLMSLKDFKKSLEAASF